MTVRETSIEAFKTIKENGLLSRVRLMVFEALVEATEAGELVSAGELFYRMKRGGRNPSHSNVATRLGELREMGIAVETGEKVCSITGMTVNAWLAVDALPKPYLKKKKGKGTCPHCNGTGDIQPCKHGNVGACAECFHEFP